MMKRGTLIGISGRKHHGKSAIALIIASLVQPQGSDRYAELAFAAELKNTCRTLWDLSDAQLYGDQKEVVDPRWGVTPRVIMQQMGSFARSVHKDTWVRVVIRQIEEARERGRLLEKDQELQDLLGEWAKLPPVVTVVTDVRHANEVEAVRRLGGVIWKVVRPGMDDSDAHESETEVDKIEPDVTVENAGSLEDLQWAVENILKQMKVLL